jgi:hypothetical protein
MTPLQQLRVDGLHVELDDGRVAIRGTVTPERRAFVRARRGEILRELAFEDRRRRVLELLERSATANHAYVAETVAHGDVAIAIAIRRSDEILSAELTIAGDRYDHERIATVLELRS